MVLAVMILYYYEVVDFVVVGQNDGVGGVGGGGGGRGAGVVGCYKCRDFVVIGDIGNGALGVL